jgi:hypothetical protein
MEAYEEVSPSSSADQDRNLSSIDPSQLAPHQQSDDTSDTSSGEIFPSNYCSAVEKKRFFSVEHFTEEITKSPRTSPNVTSFDMHHLQSSKYSILTYSLSSKLYFLVGSLVRLNDCSVAKVISHTVSGELVVQLLSNNTVRIISSDLVSDYVPSASSLLPLCDESLSPL